MWDRADFFEIHCGPVQRCTDPQLNSRLDAAQHKTSVEFAQPAIHSLTDSVSLLWAYVEHSHPAANL